MANYRCQILSAKFNSRKHAGLWPLNICNHQSETVLILYFEKTLPKNTAYSSLHKQEWALIVRNTKIKKKNGKCHEPWMPVTPVQLMMVTIIYAKVKMWTAGYWNMISNIDLQTLLICVKQRKWQISACRLKEPLLQHESWPLLIKYDKFSCARKLPAL